MLSPAQSPKKLDIPKQSSDKIQKTWARTKLARKYLNAEQNAAADLVASATSSRFNPAERDQVQNNQVPTAAPLQRDFYPDYNHISFDPNSTIPLSSPMDPLNFWRVNELSRLEDAYKFPYSAIVRVAVVDRYQKKKKKEKKKNKKKTKTK